jgi:predicted nucleic acid-binding protein
MIVISNTTPLNYLVLIGAQEILRRLFGTVHIPPAVLEELTRPKTPVIVRQWSEERPDWVIVQSPKEIDSALNPKLHEGEIQVLPLAKELKPDWLLFDDWDARIAAKERNYPVSGTLNLLEEAACRDLLAIDDVIAKLKLTNYRATTEQYQVTIENVRTRKLIQEM